MESIVSHSGDPFVLLWTEDDEDDRVMISVALERAGRSLNVVFVENGEEAWKYLAGESPFHDRELHPFPHALVSDLKMPRCGGFELIERVRGDSRFGTLPVFVFSASDLPSDRMAAQLLGVDGYIAKPT